MFAQPLFVSYRHGDVERAEAERIEDRRSESSGFWGMGAVVRRRGPGVWPIYGLASTVGGAGAGAHPGGGDAGVSGRGEGGSGACPQPERGLVRGWGADGDGSGGGAGVAVVAGPDERGGLFHRARRRAADAVAAGADGTVGVRRDVGGGVAVSRPRMDTNTRMRNAWSSQTVKRLSVMSALKGRTRQL